MHVMLAQINPTVGDFRGNTQKILAGIEKAKSQGAALVVFPEMALLGYPPGDFLLLPHFVQEAAECLKQIVKASLGIAVIVGSVRLKTTKTEKFLANTAAIIDNGILLGYQDKMLLPTYDVFDERRFFEPADKVQTWKIGGQNVGVTICEDIWQHSELVKYSSYPRDPVEELAKLSPNLVVNLSASPFSLNKFTTRLEVCSKAAITLKCPLLFCNQVGGNDSLIFDGRSLQINARGKVVKCGQGFVEDCLLVDTADHQEVVCDFSQKEDLFNALVLGIRDYFGKLGFKKACLGLSGGIDSAVVAVLAAAALGKENVMGVLMPSRYSSLHSLSDAKQLAKVLDVKTHELSIEGPFKSYLELLEPVFEGAQHDITEENMQARIRGMILMAFSNKLGCIVLSTGNKSEMAMGYATLYGDMCGGLSVISDVNKQQVYMLAKWINRQKEIIPWNTINKPPSAELRPNQKDTDSLPDYAIVDNVLQAYVEGHLSPEAIAKCFGYSLELVSDLVKRIHRNEYKRRQAPPGLRISEKAFSVGRHFPIVQKYV